MNWRVVMAAVMAALVLAGCSPSKPVKDNAATAASSKPAGPATGTLEWAANGPWRPARDVARNRWRHPVQTLRFCGLKPGQSVVEVWPGGGWYTQILAPWLHHNGGIFRVALMDPALSDAARTLDENYRRRFADDTRYGHISVSVLSATAPGIAPPESADLVLNFRIVHSWLARGMAKKAFADFYRALKPGGILCVVEHRLPAARQQDPQARSGYVQEALLKSLAIEAGFVFAAQSDINANAKDSADHPFGVWTLSPVRRSSGPGHAPLTEAQRAHYDAIGESDRMTLRFSKPPAPSAAASAASAEEPADES